MDDRKNQIEEITERIPDAIREFMNEESYQEFLKTMGKFNSRSINNCILIAMQRPDATYCEGFHAWKNKFDRTVVKGAKGIKIIQPAPYKKAEMVDKVDATGKPILGKDGAPIQEKIEHIIPAYKIGYVFAYEDTIGTPLPEVCHRLEASVDNYNQFLDALVSISSVPIVFEKIDSGANGFYHLEERDIHIKDDLSQLQTIKTVIHEMAHSLMHDKDCGTDKDTNKREREVEAESVAYTVASYYGFDTSDYSFGYIASWSKDKDLPELKERLEMIRSTAHTIITKLDGYFMIQNINEQYDMVFRNGTDYMCVRSNSDGWDCAIYNANLVKINGGKIKTSTLSMDQAIDQFCLELRVDRNNLMPANIESVLPILQKADLGAKRNMEMPMVTSTISHRI